MNQYFGLMNTISKEYRILKGETETDKSWKARILYSYLGQIAYSSLFDIQEDLNPASIIHLKSRVSDTLNSMVEMYPELRGAFPKDAESLCNEIYDIFLKTGCIYHKPNRLIPCVRKVSEGNNILLLRGHAIEEEHYLSGLGSYLIRKENDDPGISLEEMFSLQTEPLDELWKKVTDRSHFVKAHKELKFEYLRTVPPFNKGYWVDKPDLSGEISIARIGLSGGRIYYLYKAQGANLYVSQLPEWQTENYNYRSLAVGNLYTKKVLPETVYKTDGELVTLRIGYLFPPAELYLIKLYSWPTSYSVFPLDFTRMMDRGVFEEIRSSFEHLGYVFKEE